MNGFGNEGSHKQNNYGSGTFIGRDMHGNIHYELVDQKTKTAVEKLSKYAPGLADLMEKALHEGAISPEFVAALQSAVQNINEDTANALLIAGQNINEDVAWSLQDAGKNINSGVADQILQAAGTLDEARHELDNTVRSLNTTVKSVNDGSAFGYLTQLMGTVSNSAEQPEYAITPSTRKIVIWKVKVKAFILGIAIGALTIFILIHAHVKPF